GGREEVSSIADFITCARRENAAKVNGNRRLQPPVVNDDVASSSFVRIRANRDLGARGSGSGECVARETPGGRNETRSRHLGTVKAVPRDRGVGGAIDPTRAADEVIVGHDRIDTPLRISEGLTARSLSRVIGVVVRDYWVEGGRAAARIDSQENIRFRRLPGREKAIVE